MTGSGDGPSAYRLLGVVVAAVVGALVLAEVLHLVMARLRRRWELGAELSRRARRPVRVTLVLAAVLAALEGTDAAGGWVRPVERTLLIGLITAVAWLVGALAFVVEDAALQRYPVDVPDNRRARKVRTQVTLVRRVRRRGARRGGRRRHADDLPYRSYARSQPARLRRHRRRDRRPGGTVHAEQPVRRPAAGVLGLAAAGRRRRGRGRMGPRRGHHPQLCRRAPVGRPAADPAHVLLHRQAVPELDPDRGATARHGRAGRRLVGPGRRPAGTAAPDPGDHRALGWPGSQCSR